MDLQAMREEIDRVDTQLIALLHERFDIIAKVGEFKRENNLPIFVPERERAILDRIAASSSENLSASGIKLLYGIIMDLNKLNEYLIAPKEIDVPTGMGGASVRAILSSEPLALCRYLSALAAAEIYITRINSNPMPGGQMVVDLELRGETDDPQFMAALSVLADTSEQFVLL